MYISDLPQSLIELAKVQLEKNREINEAEAAKKPAAEEIVINPVIDSPHSVQTR